MGFRQRRPTLVSLERLNCSIVLQVREYYTICQVETFLDLPAVLNYVKYWTDPQYGEYCDFPVAFTFSDYCEIGILGCWIGMYLSDPTLNCSARQISEVRYAKLVIPVVKGRLQPD
jgi:hypothetical protein